MGLTSVNDDVLTLVLSYLDVAELLRTGATNVRHRRSSESNALWAPICTRVVADGNYDAQPHLGLSSAASTTRSATRCSARPSLTASTSSASRGGRAGGGCVAGRPARGGEEAAPSRGPRSLEGQAARLVGVREAAPGATSDAKQRRP